MYILVSDLEGRLDILDAYNDKEALRKYSFANSMVVLPSEVKELIRKLKLIQINYETRLQTLDELYEESEVLGLYESDEEKFERLLNYWLSYDFENSDIGLVGNEESDQYEVFKRLGYSLNRQDDIMEVEHRKAIAEINQSIY